MGAGEQQVRGPPQPFKRRGQARGRPATRSGTGQFHTHLLNLCVGEGAVAVAVPAPEPAVHHASRAGPSTKEPVVPNVLIKSNTSHQTTLLRGLERERCENAQGKHMTV